MELKTIAPGFFEIPQDQTLSVDLADLEKKFPFWQKLPASTLPENALTLTSSPFQGGRGKLAARANWSRIVDR